MEAEKTAHATRTSPKMRRALSWSLTSQTCSTPPFYDFPAKRTPVLLLTSALWGSAFPLEQAVTIASHIPLQRLPVPEAC